MKIRSSLRYVVTAVFGLPILIVGTAGCGQSPPPRDMAAAPGGEFQRSNGTLEYWRQINGAFLQMGPRLRSSQPAEVSNALRGVSNWIRDLPVLDVDQDVVGWAQNVATVAEQKANLIDNSNDPVLLLEAFMRGADGDAFGVSRELLAASRQWTANYDAVRREGFRLRAELTARYRIEFPACVI